jgi:hypothetical protein
MMNASWIATATPGQLTLVAAGNSRILAQGAQCTRATVFSAIDKSFADRADLVLVTVRRAGNDFRIATPNLSGCIENANAAPSIPELIRQYPARRFVFDVGGDDRALDALLNAFDAADRQMDRRYAILASADVAARARAAAPSAWTVDMAAAETRFDAYVWRGWMGVVPPECRSRTIAIPIDKQWMVWGWPNRFLSRMEQAGTRTILTGPAQSGEGVTVAEQIPQVPRAFKGALWVENIAAIGPALRQ